jgi:hypothetical protein
MGYPGDLNPTTAPFHAGHANQKVFISRLVNSVYYSISTCFIMELTMTNQVEYRLLAIHKKKVLTDRNYRTLRGARIAFEKQFKKMAWRDDVAAEWSHFYPPNRDWIEEKLAAAEKAVH